MPFQNVITAEDKAMRLSWRGGVCVFLATVGLGLFFVKFGRFDLARPTFLSIAMVATAIALRWRLRRHVWFWITMVLLAASHIPLVLFVPWTTKWVPAIFTAPLGVLDLYAMLWVLSVAGRYKGEPIPAHREHAHPVSGRHHSSIAPQRSSPPEQS